MTTTRSTGSTGPQWSTPRTPDRPTYGPAVARVAELVGTPLMPHQRHIADVTGEVLPDGRMAYPVVLLKKPRRGGKTGLMLPTLVQRARAIPRARCWYTAQTGTIAGLVFREEWLDQLEAGPLARSIVTSRRNGAEALTVKASRGRVGVFAPTKKALHSQDADVVVVDESWAFDDLTGTLLEQAFRPAQATRRQRQTWIISAGGNAASTWLKRWSATARALPPGPDQGIAHFDFTVPHVETDPGVWVPDPDVDLDDPAVWAATHPAVGLTIDLDFLIEERKTMGATEFRRAYLNIDSDEATEPLWPADAWAAANVDDLAVPTGPGAWLAYDVAHDQSWVSVGIAGRMPDGQLGAELVARRRGTGWAADFLEKLRLKRGLPLVADKRAPTSNLTRELRARGLTVNELTADEFVDACGALYGDVTAAPEPRIRIRRAPYLDAAVDGAATRQLGDGWALSRSRSTADVAPLVTVAVAAHKARHHVTQAPGIFTAAS